MSPAQAPDGDRALAPLLLTVSQAASLLAISTRSAWGLVASGRLGVVRLGRRTTRVERAAVERLIASLRGNS